MAREVLHIGFDRLKLQELVAFTLPTNLASRSVMEKVGFRFEREIRRANNLQVLYKLASAEFRISTV